MEIETEGFMTTSAGLWATVGVGMALGAGMYVRIRPAAFLCRGI